MISIKHPRTILYFDETYQRRAKGWFPWGEGDEIDTSKYLQGMEFRKQYKGWFRVAKTESFKENGKYEVVKFYMERMPNLDYEFINRVLEITQSHPDSKAREMFELAPGVVNVFSADADKDVFFDNRRWEYDEKKGYGDPGAIYKGWARRGIYKIQQDWSCSTEKLYRVVRHDLIPRNPKLKFHDEPIKVDLEERLARN